MSETEQRDDRPTSRIPEAVRFFGMVMVGVFTVAGAASASFVSVQAPIVAPVVSGALALLAGGLLWFRLGQRQEREETASQSDEALDAERARRVQSEERFNFLIEAIGATPWTADLDAQSFTYVGAQIETLTGYPAETWRASGFWTQHIHPGDRTRILNKEIPALPLDDYSELAYRVRAANGRVLHVRNIVALTRVDGAVRAQGFFLDETSLKVAVMGEEDALRRAEQANRVKSEFMANMSHELRTPLNAIIGFSEIMKDEVFGEMQPTYREYAGSIYDSGSHLLGLINDMLDLSKIEAGRIELIEDEADLGELLRSCVELLSDRARSAGLHLEVDAPENGPVARADDRRLRQVVLNLLSNAIKFTEPGGRVSVRLARDDDGGATLWVRDTGVGMTPEEIPRALEKFGQVTEDRLRAENGTGLGLPITKSLIEMHGGSLDLTSQKGVGTAVRVTLPASRILS